MTPEAKYGQTAPAPVTILPELAIDMSEGQPPLSNLGKTEVPVHVLPELAPDFGPTVPALHLQLTLRPGVPPWQVSVDLFRLYAAVTGVPWLIRAEDSDYSTGPDSRRGGLGGDPGYPSEQSAKGDDL